MMRFRQSGKCLSFLLFRNLYQFAIITFLERYQKNIKSPSKSIPFGTQRWIYVSLDLIEDTVSL